MAETFAEKLAQLAKTPEAIFLRFRTSTPKPNRVYIFVEGHEDREYFGLVSTILGVDAEFIVCWGKHNLDEILESYQDSNLSDRIVQFVRDRDFDEVLGVLPNAPELFITCGYSVENYVFSEGSVRAFLLNKVGVDAGEIDVDLAVKEFTEAVAKLFDWLKPIHERVLAAKRRGDAVDLGVIKIETYSKLIVQGKDLPEATLIGELATLGLNTEPEDSDVQLAGAYHHQDPVMGLRGKFLATLFFCWITKRVEDLLARHKAKEISHLNRKVASELSRDHIFSVVCPFAAPNDRLRAFLIPAS